MPAEKKSLPIDLNEAEQEKLRQIATKWGVSLSDAIRKLIREAAL
jgi:macrodomain Ter protein organizer (MatP/YcbG family)